VCLREGRTVKKKMLCCLIVTCAAMTHQRPMLSDTVKIAGQKRAVTCTQLSDGDALASGPAKSPVELQTLSPMRVRWLAECGSSR